MIDRAAGRVLYPAPTGLGTHPDVKKKDKIVIQGDLRRIEIDDRLEFPNCQGPRPLNRVRSRMLVLRCNGYRVASRKSSIP
jgi:hypothetical protein